MAPPGGTNDHNRVRYVLPFQYIPTHHPRNVYVTKLYLTIHGPYQGARCQTVCFTARYALGSAHCTMGSAHCTMGSAHCTIGSAHYTMGSAHCIADSGRIVHWAAGFGDHLHSCIFPSIAPPASWSSSSSSPPWSWSSSSLSSERKNNHLRKALSSSELQTPLTSLNITRSEMKR